MTAIIPIIILIQKKKWNQYQKVNKQKFKLMFKNKNKRNKIVDK